MLISWQNIAPDEAPAALVAQAISETLQQALLERNRAALALAGGSTPRPVYETLGQWLIDWSCVTLVPTDERFVPIADTHSNEGMMRASLRTDITRSARFISLYTPAASVEEAASSANKRLSPLAEPFDLLLAGVGSDGHIASLFPGASELPRALDANATDDVFAIHPPPGSPQPLLPRLTLGRRRLLRARRILLLCSGIAKRRLVEQAFERPDAERWPVSLLVSAGAPPLHVMYLEQR